MAFIFVTVHLQHSHVWIAATGPLGRMIFTVVGLTEGIVSSSGDSTAYVSLQDAQELQFLKGNEAVRNERARLQADLRADPGLATNNQRVLRRAALLETLRKRLAGRTAEELAAIFESAGLPFAPIPGRE